MTRDAMLALLAQRREALARLDAEALAALHAEDGVVESPLAGGTATGRDAIRELYQAFFAAFNPSFEEEDVLIDGSRAVVVFRTSGTDRGGFMGMAPSGRSFVVPMVLITECDQGLITRERRIYDFTGFLVQVGVMKAKPV
jgi:steroid delta-isomerase-like uncharacterized protein